MLRRHHTPACCQLGRRSLVPKSGPTLVYNRSKQWLCRPAFNTYCGCCRSPQEQPQQQPGGQVGEDALIEAGRWRGRPRWAAPPEPPRNVVTGAPRVALLGATNRQGLAAAGSGVQTPVSLAAAQPAACRPSVGASAVACQPDDSVLIGSPERCPPLRRRASAGTGLTADTAAAAKLAATAAAASTASASVLQGSVVVPRARQDAITGMRRSDRPIHSPAM